MTDRPDRHLNPVREPPFDPYEDRVSGPPRDEAAERAVLGVLLNSPNTLPTLGGLRAEDFYRPLHATLYGVIQALVESGTPVDPVIVRDCLTREGRGALLDDPTVLIGLMAEAPVPSAASHHAQIVARTAALRRVVEAARRTIHRAEHLADPVELVTALYDDLDGTFGGAAEATGSWDPVDLTAALAGTDPDPPPELLHRVDGAALLYSGGIHTISGEPGSGKTWFALLGVAQCLGRGETVAMIDFEDRPARVVARLLGIGARPEAIGGRLRYVRPHEALGTFVAALERAVAGASLVVMDGVTEAMALEGLDPNDNADVAEFYARLPRRIADTSGAAVLMIDHVVKDSERQGRWGIGGQHKLAGIDGAAYVCRIVDAFGRGRRGRAQITVSKDRPGHVEEIAVGRTVGELVIDARDEVLRCRLEAPSATPTDGAGNLRPTHLMERVSRWLEGSPGASRKQVEDSVRGKRDYVRLALDQLVAEGRVEVTDGPRGARAYRVLDAYREDFDEA